MYNNTGDEITNTNPTKTNVNDKSSKFKSSYGQIEEMKRKQLSLFTRTYLPIFRNMNFNMTGQ